ncbi:hypothetical protein FLM48_00335 [Shewanella sp. Scap07]|uniref:hypothetical protein n=1 Tax=Shewanella sp. Scap07 TaxID=2589987 RepID=UPI0015BC1EB5|nr:hypothetical protein [Shewanella sp. Scap07]QLE83669.1 hypothetical protein FLM48_00335 [Shewanella sp. Scap07]
MSITINQVDIQSIAQLPDNIKTLFQSIPQAETWLETMRNNPEYAFSFSSAEEFIEQLNIGLRNSSLLYLPKVNVVADIKKLLELSSNDLRDLFNLENQSADSPNAAASRASILASNHLIDNQAFDKITQFYKKHNLTTHPLTWSAAFHEQITLYETIVYSEQAFSQNNKQASEACEWALAKAQNLAEFGRYYLIYLSWAHEFQGKRTAKNLSLDRIIETLTSTVLDNLECPVVTFELDQINLHRAIEQWCDSDKQTLGFTDLSSGLLNITLNIDLNNESDVREQAHGYIKQLQKQLATNLAADSYVNQAGLCRYYRFDLPNNTVQLNLDANGCLCVYSDKPNISKIGSSALVKRS